MAQPRLPYVLMLLGAAVLAATGLLDDSVLAEEHLAGLMKGLGTGLLLAGLVARLQKGTRFADRSIEGTRAGYFKAVVPLVTLYVAFMLFMDDLLAATEHDLLRVLIALVPAVLITAYALVMLRYVRVSDELQRRTELEAIALSAMLVSLGCMIAGCLSRAGLVQIEASTALMWVFPLLGIGYGVIRLFLIRRYLP